MILYPISGLVRLLLLVLPFRFIAKCLGEIVNTDESFGFVSADQRCAALRIGKICSLVARCTPWETKCLVQAIMAKALLAWYGIPCLMLIGVSRSDDANEPFKAHAWVKVDAMVILGQKGHKSFTILARYASRSLRAGPSVDSRVL